MFLLSYPYYVIPSRAVYKITGAVVPYNTNTNWKGASGVLCLMLVLFQLSVSAAYQIVLKIFPIIRCSNRHSLSLTLYSIHPSLSNPPSTGVYVLLVKIILPPPKHIHLSHVMYVQITEESYDFFCSRFFHMLWIITISAHNTYLRCS